MAYSEYSDFSTLYGTDVMTSEQYAALLPRATAAVDVYTARRAATATGYKMEAVKRAECALVKLIAEQDATAQGIGVTSVSNDGYSESYEAATPEAVSDMQRQTCAFWLSGTGLMSAL